ncbi:hypothetical protein SB861_40295 [Paraburkholderia sp. SIMBA_049]
MQHIIEANGNLTFIADAASMEDLQTFRDRVCRDDVRFLYDMLDTFGFSGNGKLHAIRPGDVDALTDAPMLSDGVELHDEPGLVGLYDKVWWFPNYQVEDFAATLLDKGRVTFASAR